MSIASFPSGSVGPDPMTCCLCTKPISRGEATFGPATAAQVPRFMCGTHLAKGRLLIMSLVDYYLRPLPSHPYWMEADSE